MNELKQEARENIDDIVMGWIGDVDEGFEWGEQTKWENKVFKQAREYIDKYIDKATIEGYKKGHIEASLEERKRALDKIKETRPLGDSSSHHTYNDGKRDGADQAIKAIES